MDTSQEFISLIHTSSKCQQNVRHHSIFQLAKGFIQGNGVVSMKEREFISNITTFCDEKQMENSMIVPQSISLLFKVHRIRRYNNDV